jgi:hypothetical protein
MFCGLVIGPINACSTPMLVPTAALRDGLGGMPWPLNRESAM